MASLSDEVASLSAQMQKLTAAVSNLVLARSLQGTLDLRTLPRNCLISLKLDHFVKDEHQLFDENTSPNCDTNRQPIVNQVATIDEEDPKLNKNGEILVFDDVFEPQTDHNDPEDGQGSNAQNMFDEIPQPNSDADLSQRRQLKKITFGPHQVFNEMPEPVICSNQCRFVSCENNKPITCHFDHIDYKQVENEQTHGHVKDETQIDGIRSTQNQHLVDELHGFRGEYDKKYIKETQLLNAHKLLEEMPLPDFIREMSQMTQLMEETSIGCDHKLPLGKNDNITIYEFDELCADDDPKFLDAQEKLAELPKPISCSQQVQLLSILLGDIQTPVVPSSLLFCHDQAEQKLLKLAVDQSKIFKPESGIENALDSESKVNLMYFSPDINKVPHILWCIFGNNLIIKAFLLNAHAFGKMTEPENKSISVRDHVLGVVITRVTYYLITHKPKLTWVLFDPGGFFPAFFTALMGWVNRLIIVFSFTSAPLVWPYALGELVMLATSAYHSLLSRVPGPYFTLVFMGKEVHSRGKLMELALWDILNDTIELPSIQYVQDYQSYRISLVNVVTFMNEDIVEAQISNHGVCSVRVVDNVNYELCGITIVECSPRLQDATYAYTFREEIEEILMNTIGLPSRQCGHELPFLNHVTTEVFGHICPTDVVWFLPLDAPMMTLFVDIAPIFFLPLKYAHVQEVTIKCFKKQNDYPFVIMSVNYGTGESMLMLVWRLTLEDKGDFEGVRRDNDRLSVLLATQDSWRPIWDEMNFKIESQGEKEILENIFSQVHQFGHQQMKSNLTYKIFIAASNEFDSCFFVYDSSESCEIPVARFNCGMMVCSVHGGDHLDILISWAVQVFVAPINGFDVETEKWFSCIIANFHQAAFMIQRAILLDKYIRHHLISSCYTLVTRILSFAHLGGLSNSGKLDINSRDGTSDVSTMMLEPKKLSSWLFKENLRVAIKWYNKSVIIYIFDPGGSPMIRIIDASLYEYRLL